MGGNALKTIKTVRKLDSEYIKISNEITKKLIELSIEHHVVKSYKSKQSHGDLDVIIVSNGAFNHIDFIKENYKPDEIHNNGNVISFNYYNFQIDFNFVNYNVFESAKTYMDFDPLGNIMGKTYHKFGLSYGWNGLFYKFRNFSGANSKNLLISNDVRKIFEFGGYDYDRYLQGFETIEDIFNFAIAGKYFDSEIFQMNNLKSIDKKRNRKRGSYHLFLKYLENNNINTRYDFMRNKDLYLPMIDKEFPEAKLLEKLKALREHDKMLKIISQKFNGDIVMSWLPNLQGKELGNAIRNFRNYLGDDYKDFILDNTYDTIRECFMKTYGKNNNID